jgi:hypothetical protein
MLRSIFGPKREEVTGNCRKLHDEDHSLMHLLLFNYIEINVTVFINIQIKI